MDFTTNTPAVPVPQSSPLLCLPGEIRDMIYSLVLEKSTSSKHSFQKAHALACTSRQFRAEFWPLYLNQIVWSLRIDRRDYATLLNVFYPRASSATMERYVGNFMLEVPFTPDDVTFHPRVPPKQPEVLALRKGTNGLPPAVVAMLRESSNTADLLPLVKLLRASPLIRFRLSASSDWICHSMALRHFLDDARTNPAWVVAPVLSSLTLRLRQGLMAQRTGTETWDRYWIVDVGLKKELSWVYEVLGLMAWLQMRDGRGNRGVTVCVEWVREEEAPRRRQKWGRKLGDGWKKAWKRLMG